MVELMVEMIEETTVVETDEVDGVIMVGDVEDGGVVVDEDLVKLKLLIPLLLVKGSMECGLIIVCVNDALEVEE
jgi:hypothetical protein